MGHDRRAQLTFVAATRYSIGCSTATRACREIALLGSTWLSDDGIRGAKVNFPVGDTSHNPADVAHPLR
jgi:hypothetical protein